MTSPNEIKILTRQCTDMINETRKVNTLLSRARRYEIRNLRSVLLMLLDLNQEEINRLKNTFEETKREIYNLISNSQSAGCHSYLLTEEDE